MIIPLNPTSISFTSPITGFAFDLEGTLVDLEPLHHQAHLLACRQFGLDKSLSQLIQLLPHLVGGPGETIAQEVSVLLPHIDPQMYRSTQRHLFESEFLALKHISPRPGVLEFLSHLQRSGKSLAIGSLTETTRAHRILELSRLISFFSVFVFKEDVAHLKPAPDVYLSTATKLGISPASQLVFEDSPQGAQAAHQAGSVSLAVPVYPQVNSRFTATSTLAIFSDWPTLASTLTSSLS